VDFEPSGTTSKPQKSRNCAVVGEKIAGEN